MGIWISHGSPETASDAAPAEDGHSGGSTIARARLREPVVEPEPERGVDRKRVWIGLGAAALAVALVAAGTMALSGGDEDEPATTTTVPRPDEVVVLAPPSAVKVLPTPDGYTVYFEAPDAATSVEVEMLTPPRQGTVLTADPDSGQRKIAVQAGSLCVVLRSVGERGRLSGNTKQVCADRLSPQD